MVSAGARRQRSKKLTEVLAYEQKQGPHEANIIRQSLRDGRALPKAIQNAPTLEEYNRFYFNAYQELCTCRGYEGGFIPWTAVKTYAEHYSLYDDDFWLLFNIITQTDLAIKAAAKPNPTGGGIGR